MKTCLKIELYDTGICLINKPLHEGLEYSGWSDSSTTGEEICVADGFGFLLRELFDFSESKIEEYWDKMLKVYGYGVPLFEKKMERHYCQMLEAKETSKGVLKIKATLSFLDQTYSINVSYKGSYTVFWDED